MSSQYSSLEQNRLAKLHSLRRQGIEPFPPRARRTHTSLQAIQLFEASERSSQGESLPQTNQLTLACRLRAMRPMGKITFAHIEDGDGRVQLFLRENELGQELLELFNREFDLGDFIQASGEMFRTRSGEITLRVDSFILLAKAITPLPAAKDEIVDGQVVSHATLS